MQENPTAPEDATSRAAALLAKALQELYGPLSGQTSATLAEVSSGRQVLEDMLRRIDQQLREEREQRLVLAGQLTNLAAALDNLVGHLHSLSRLMADLVERVAPPSVPAAEAARAEAPFLPGGEGLTLTLLNVPGFQALMDFQKALGAMEQVASASVERFQEGDSRLVVRLRSPVLGSELAATLRGATGHAVVVEEAKPELQSLRLKVVSPG